jgi:MYXO-CTERM domain-containing protein
MTSMAGLNVCGPGTNMCNPSGEDDGGVTEPDAGVGPTMDSGVANADGGDGEGGRVVPLEMGGCRCSAPGATSADLNLWALMASGLALSVVRRRRARA